MRTRHEPQSYREDRRAKRNAKTDRFDGRRDAARRDRNDLAEISGIRRQPAIHFRGFFRSAHGWLRRPSRRIDWLASVSLWPASVARWCYDNGGREQPAARIVSPEVAADRRVTFRLAAPQAREILLSGSSCLAAGRSRKTRRAVERDDRTARAGDLSLQRHDRRRSHDRSRTIPTSRLARRPARSRASSRFAAISRLSTTRRRSEHGDIRTHSGIRSKSLGPSGGSTVYTPPGTTARRRRDIRCSICCTAPTRTRPPGIVWAAST